MILQFLFSQIPYSHHKNNRTGRIFADILNGVPPATRPSVSTQSHPMLWMLLEACWEEDVASRATAFQIWRVLHSRLLSHTSAPNPTAAAANQSSTSRVANVSSGHNGISPSTKDNTHSSSSREYLKNLPRILSSTSFTPSASLLRHPRKPSSASILNPVSSQPISHLPLFPSPIDLGNNLANLGPPRDFIGSALDIPTHLQNNPDYHIGWDSNSGYYTSTNPTTELAKQRVQTQTHDPPGFNPPIYSYGGPFIPPFNGSTQHNNTYYQDSVPTSLETVFDMVWEQAIAASPQRSVPRYRIETIDHSKILRTRSYEEDTRNHY